MPLGHHLQHRRLHLRRGAVDLVGEHEVRHHRAELDVELLAALPVDPGAEDVGGHQVRGELQAGERAADDPGDRLHRERLRHPGHALEQQVPAREQADEHPLDQPVLPDDHALDLEHHTFEQLAVVRGGGHGWGHRSPSGHSGGHALALTEQPRPHTV